MELFSYHKGLKKLVEVRNTEKILYKTYPEY